MHAGDATGIAAAPGTGRVTVARIGIALCYLACFTIPWTAVKVGGSLRLGDVFLLLAIVFLVAADLDHRMPSLPPWIWLFVSTIVFVGVVHELFPLPEAYSLARVTVDGAVVRRGLIDPSGSNLSVLIRFLIAIIGLPVIFNRARYFDHRALRRSAIAFTAGAALSGLIAFTDGHNLTAIAVHITGTPGAGNRSSGLTENPNYVALGCVFCLPFAVWLMVDPVRRTRLWGLAAFVALLLGFYGSGSRAGAGAGIAGLVLAFVLIRRYRDKLTVVALVLAVLAAAAFVAEPSLGKAVLHALRLTGGQGSGSDRARDVINTQARHDFFHSPVYGVGFQVAGEAHIVYLQALAAGGLILFTGYLIFLIASLVRCLRVMSVNQFAAPLFSSIVAGAIFNAAQNALTLRIVYVPAMIAAILPLTARADVDGADSAADAPAVVDQPAR